MATEFLPLPPGRGTKPMDLTGRRVGLLTVLGYVGRHRTGELYWLCRCDCGNDKTATTRGLHRKHTISCGCVKHRGLIFGGYNKKDYGEARFNDLFLSYKRSAASRGHSFDLSKDEFRALTKDNCHYCGVVPMQVVKAGHGVNGEYVYNGIDRVNNSIGYTPENSRPCCGQCNMAKNTLGEVEFYEWIERVSARGPRYGVDERDLIRVALIEGGAPDRDIDWMTASCPSVRTARQFYPRNP